MQATGPSFSFLSGNPRRPRIDCGEGRSGSFSSEIGDIMHGVVQAVARSRGARSCGSLPTSMPISSPTSGPEAPLGDGQLKQILVKLTTLYEELKPKLMRFAEARISPRL